jgi:murein DD-endopeptidase MepM/ murein hydrolase activator NlpD
MSGPDSRNDRYGLAAVLSRRAAAGLLGAALVRPATILARPEPALDARFDPATDTYEPPPRRRRRDRDRNADRTRPDPPKPSSASIPELSRERASGSAAETGSVRPRGASAPVRLERKATPEPEPKEAKPNSSRQTGGKPAAQPEPKRKRASNKKTGDGRVWPMSQGTYTFTQHYGCVAQIAGYYPSGSGCPSDRPVVHRGIDLGAATGAIIYAAASGWVTEAGYDRDHGLANTRIIIQHDRRNDGYATEYLHWSATYVERGDYVEAGEPIAEVGSVGYSTGPHLHFAVISFDRDDFVDPLTWLPKRRGEGLYRDLPRGKSPVDFDDAGPEMPHEADPNPAPVPERTDVPAETADESETAGKEAARSERDRRKRAKRKSVRNERDERRSSRTQSSADDGRKRRRDRVAAESGEPVVVNPSMAANEPAAESPDRERKRDRRDRKRSQDTGSAETDKGSQSTSGDSSRKSKDRDDRERRDSSKRQDVIETAVWVDERSGSSRDMTRRGPR